MKPKLILGLALVLSGGLFGCSTTTQPTSAELTWPNVAAGTWAFVPAVVDERFKQASIKAMGTEDDIASINKSIISDNPRENVHVIALRWLSKMLVMARVRAMEAECIYVVEKLNGRWTVRVHYTQWIS